MGSSAGRGGGAGGAWRPAARSGSACSAKCRSRLATDRLLALPASKKTRALLGYLIATGRAHRRERLCDLFWDGPDDPRAELRWCLSKIRPLLAGGGAELAADRQRVGVELRGAVVDLVTVRSLLGRGVAEASTDALRQAASLIGGEFLDGLDLPACYIYQEWCMAEREAVSRMRLAALQTLAERLHDRPEEALPYARSITIADPLCEAGHAAVVRLLSRLGRNKEASAHYEHARRIFETELGAAPTDELEQARRALQIAAAAGRTTARSAARPSSTPLVPERSFPAVAATVGRARETALIERLVASTMEGQADEIVLVSGAAGIGKSHLLGCFADHMASAGGRVWRARGFEPESTRPYGIWFDLLRAVAHDRPRGELPEQLGVLLPGGGEAAPADRSGLYEAVGDLLRRAAAERPAAILLDDIQWIDEASSSLLHFVVRSVAASAGLLVVCAARDGEIDDNAAAAAVFRSLARDGRLQTLVSNRLDQAETAELVRRIDPAAEAERIYRAKRRQPAFRDRAGPRPSPRRSRARADDGVRNRRPVRSAVRPGARGAPVGGRLGPRLLVRRSCACVACGRSGTARRARRTGAPWAAAADRRRRL